MNAYRSRRVEKIPVFLATAAWVTFLVALAMLIFGGALFESRGSNVYMRPHFITSTALLGVAATASFVSLIWAAFPGVLREWTRPLLLLCSASVIQLAATALLAAYAFSK
jgi:predicted Abi (CAAX) family protease